MAKKTANLHRPYDRSRLAAAAQAGMARASAGYIAQATAGTEDEASASTPAPTEVRVDPQAKKHFCCVAHGPQAEVTHLEGTRYQVQVTGLPPGYGQDPATVDIKDVEGEQPEPVKAYLLACGIRNVDHPIGCQPMEA